MPTPQENRPLSPHLSVYRWQISNTLSILHRVTGFGLTLGLVLFALWLIGAAWSPLLFNLILEALGSIVGELFLFGWTVAFFYHLGNGIRHLGWDFGRGFMLADMAATGWLVVVFAISMSIFTWTLIALKVDLI